MSGLGDRALTLTLSCEARDHFRAAAAFARYHS